MHEQSKRCSPLPYVVTCPRPFLRLVSKPVIRDTVAYAELCEREERETLRRMTVDESIALGEALLTSELVLLCAAAEDDEPTSLAHALGIATARA